MKKKFSVLSLVVLFSLLLASCMTTKNVYGVCGPIVIKDYAGVTVDSIPYAYDISLGNSVLSYKENIDSARIVKVVQNYQVYTDRAEEKVLKQETTLDHAKTAYLMTGITVAAALFIYWWEMKVAGEW